MESEEKQKPQSSGNEGHGAGQHVCHSCGWVYPNPHPSAKHRRAHKKHCGKGEAGPKPAAGGGNGAEEGRKGSDEEGSDEEQRKRAESAAAEKSKPAEQEGEVVVHLGGDEEKVSFGSEGGDRVLGKDSTVGSHIADIDLDRHASLPNDHIQVIETNCGKNQLESGKCLASHAVSGDTDLHAATLKGSVSTKTALVNGTEEESECCTVQSALDDSLNINDSDVGKCRKNNKDVSIPTGPILSCDPATCSSVMDRNQRIDNHREINNFLDCSNATVTRMTGSPEEVSLNGKELELNTFHLQDRQMDAQGTQSQGESFSFSGSLSLELRSDESPNTTADSAQFERPTDALQNFTSKANEDMTLNTIVTPPNTNFMKVAELNPNVTATSDVPVVPSDLLMVTADVSAVSTHSLVQIQGNDHFHGGATNELNSEKNASKANVNVDRSSLVNFENETEGYNTKLEGSESLGLGVLGDHPHATVEGSLGTQDIDGEPAASHETFAAIVESEEVERECQHEGQEAGLSVKIVSGDCNVLTDASSVGMANIIQASPEITLDGQPAASHDSYAASNETYAATAKSEEVEIECQHEGHETGLSSKIVSGDCNVPADASGVAVANITQGKETAKISDESQVHGESVISYTDVGDCRCEQHESKCSHSDRESIPQSKCKIAKSEAPPEIDSIHDLQEKNQDAGLTMSLGHLKNIGEQHSGEPAHQNVIERTLKESAVGNNTSSLSTQTEHHSEYIKAESDLMEVPQVELPLQKVQMEKISGPQLDSQNDLQEKVKGPAVDNDNCHSLKEADVQNPHIENGLAIPLRRESNLSDDIEIDLCRVNVYNFTCEEPVSSLAETHSLQKTLALDDSKTNNEADYAEEKQIHDASEEQPDSYTPATSLEFTSQKDNADGLSGFISVGHSTDDRPVHNARTPETTNTNSGKDLPSSNLAVGGGPAANGVDNNYFFEQPSADVAVEPGTRSPSHEIHEDGSRSVCHEIKEPLIMADVEPGRWSISHEIQEPSIMANVEPGRQSISREIQEPGRQSISHEIELIVESRNELEGEKKNEEITANVTKSNSGRPRVPLKSLLAEANLESKEEDYKTPLLAKKGRALQDERHGYGKSNRSSFNRTDHKEWNSPAKLPINQNGKRVKGRPHWLPFICCSCGN